MDDFESTVFEPGQRIFDSGDSADTLYIIKSASVDMLGDNGQAFAQVGPGQSFGEQAILVGGTRSAGTLAHDRVECLMISAEKANSLLKSYSPLLVPIFEALLMQQSMHNSLRQGL